MTKMAGGKYLLLIPLGRLHVNLDSIKIMALSPNFVNELYRKFVFDGASIKLKTSRHNCFCMTSKAIYRATL